MCLHISVQLSQLAVLVLVLEERVSDRGSAAWLPSSQMICLDLGGRELLLISSPCFELRAPFDSALPPALHVTQPASRSPGCCAAGQAQSSVFVKAGEATGGRGRNRHECPCCPPAVPLLLF